MFKKNRQVRLKKIKNLLPDDRALVYCEKLFLYIEGCKPGTQLTVSTLSGVLVSSESQLDFDDLYKALNVLCSPIINIIESEFVFYPVGFEDTPIFLDSESISLLFEKNIIIDPSSGEEIENAKSKVYQVFVVTEGSSDERV